MKRRANDWKYGHSHRTQKKRDRSKKVEKQSNPEAPFSVEAPDLGSFGGDINQ